MIRAHSILLAIVSLSACSTASSVDDCDTNPGLCPGDGGVPDAGVEISYPLLDCDPLVPEFCGYPFPSNVYTEEDADTVTGRRVAFGEAFMLGNDPGPWDRSDGFSAGTPILAFLPGATGSELGGPEDIEQSLSDTSPTIVLDVESGERVPHFAEIDVRSPTAEQRSLMIRPVVRLRDDARYIVAFRGLHDAGGATIEPSSAFAALRDDTESNDDSISARRQLYDDIFEHLADLGWARDEIQIAWDFNTASDQNNTRWLLSMRDQAFELLGEGGPEYTLGDCGNEWESDYIAFRVCGTYQVPLFMSTPEPGGSLLFGEDGLPKVNEETPWADIPFELDIPKSASPDNPAPSVQYGHGLFGDREQIHGGGSQHNPSFMNEYNYAFVATELQGMSTYDFDTVALLLAVGDFSGLETMFDRLHQGFVNYLLLTRMMKTSFAADETYGPYIKGEEAYYYGNSQGGIMGTVFMALSPDVERGALGVMGQPYSLLLFRSVDFNDFLEAIKLHYKDFREHQLLIGLAQMLWDRVEPTGYTQHIRTNNFPNTNPKEVLARVAVADHQVPTLGGHIMARTLDAPLLDQGVREVWGLTTVTSTDGGSFYAEYDFGLPGEPLCNMPMSLCGDPHTDVSPRVSARDQLDEFFQRGTGTNHCRLDDGDPHPAAAEGVCSYPSIAGCNMGETAEDTQALCLPSATP
ncbi:MAG: hypothetical protein WBM48_11765 [Polyangiales bacterium]